MNNKFIYIKYLLKVSENNTNRQYRVRCPERSETLFLATEISSEWQKKILGSMRRLSLILRDVSGATAFTLTKSVSSGCLPGSLHARISNLRYIRILI